MNKFFIASLRTNYLFNWLLSNWFILQLRFLVAPIDLKVKEFWSSFQQSFNLGVNVVQLILTFMIILYLTDLSRSMSSTKLQIPFSCIISWMCSVAGSKASALDALISFNGPSLIISGDGSWSVDCRCVSSEFLLFLFIPMIGARPSNCTTGSINHHCNFDYVLIR